MSSDTGAEAPEMTDSSVSNSGGRISVFGEDLSTALQGGALAVALVFALISAVSFYVSAQRVIRVWVSSPYRPLFAMGFNLAVLLAMVAIVTALARRLSA